MQGQRQFFPSLLPSEIVPGYPVQIATPPLAQQPLPRCPHLCPLFSLAPSTFLLSFTHRLGHSAMTDLLLSPSFRASDGHPCQMSSTTPFTRPSASLQSCSPRPRLEQGAGCHPPCLPLSLIPHPSQHWASRTSLRPPPLSIPARLLTGVPPSSPPSASSRQPEFCLEDADLT